MRSKPSDTSQDLALTLDLGAEPTAPRAEAIPGQNGAMDDLAEARVIAPIFDPQRLRVARQLRKKTRAAVADGVGVSAAAVGQWEAGEVRPKAQTLTQLAEELEFPVAFFATGGHSVPDLAIHNGFFRSLRKGRQIDREAAIAHAALVAEVVDVIERHAKLPDLDIPSYPLSIDASPHEVEQAAAQVRAHWGLGTEPIDDMTVELERRGAAVVRLVLAEDVDAFSWGKAKRPVVILGSDKGKRDRSRFDAAHELAHLVMHADRPDPANRDLERQAHRFAGALLLPSEQLVAEWRPGRISWAYLLTLKQRWQVSLAALLYRARDLELITQTAYESAIKYSSRRGWRKHEPGDLGPPERPQLLTRAVEALEAAGVDRTQLADEAHIHVADLERYLVAPGARPRVSVEI
ncbi:MAG: XRE family transcriptional regulator [Baekduia sp.]